MVPGSALRAWWRWDLLQVCEVQWQRAGPRGQRRQQTRTQTRGPRVPRRSLLSSSVDERKLRESGGRGCWNVSAATQNVPYVQEHTHLHTHTHTCTHTCIHKHTHAYMHTCTHMHMHTHTHTCTCTRTHTHAHTSFSVVKTRAAAPAKLSAEVMLESWPVHPLRTMVTICVTRLKAARGMHALCSSACCSASMKSPAAVSSHMHERNETCA